MSRSKQAHICRLTPRSTGPAGKRLLSRWSVGGGGPVNASVSRLPMSGIADDELMSQLNAYMRSVIAQWTWSQLAALGTERHVEYRGPENNLVTFDLQILENEANVDRPYLNVSVSACDFREGKGLGSAYAPLCNNFIYYADGGLDVEELSKFGYAWQDG